MKKRIICLLLGLSMVFAGCGAVQEGNEKEEETKDKTENKEDVEKSIYDFDEHISVEIALWEFDGYGNDALADYIEEKFNVEIINILQDGEYTEKFAMWATADTLPDSFAGYPMMESWYKTFVDDGMLREIPEEMLAKYPTLYETCKNCVSWEVSKEQYGGIYYIPRMYSTFATGERASVLYRKDWAEAVGILEVPTDMDALYEMFYAFTYGDPDGNGEDDTYGYVGRWNELLWGFGATADHWVTLEDGSVTFGYLDKTHMLEGLKWLRKAYENGLLDQEFSTDSARWIGGNAGAFMGNIDGYWANRYLDVLWAEAYPEMGDPLDYIGVSNSFAPHAGETRATLSLTSNTSGTVFAYDTTDEELERLLAMYDFFLTDEGWLLRYWGLEGEDYEISDDGTITKLHDENMREKYPSIFIQNWASWDGDFPSFPVELPNPGDPDIRDEIKTWSREAQTVANTYSVNHPYSEEATLIAGTTDAYASYIFDSDAKLASIIAGTEDVETMYDAFVEEAYEAGAQKVIDTTNAMMK